MAHAPLRPTGTPRGPGTLDSSTSGARSLAHPLSRHSATATTSVPVHPQARSIVAPVVLGVMGIALWAVLAATVGPALVPGPVSLTQRLVADLAEGDLLRAAGATLTVSLLGCLLGLVIALPLGYLIARSRTAAAALSPYLAASQAIPAVAVAPLLVLWLGYDNLPRAILCALLVFFPILLNTVLGLAGLDQDVLDAARVDGAGRWPLLWRIEAPMALPSVLTGVRNGFVLSVTGAVVGEFVMGGVGLGQLLSIYRASSDVTGMVATLVVLAVLAVGFSMAVRGLERILRWW